MVGNFPPEKRDSCLRDPLYQPLRASAIGIESIRGMSWRIFFFTERFYSLDTLACQLNP
jgi:hypothetical protein